MNINSTNNKCVVFLRGGCNMIHKVLNAYFAKKNFKKLTSDVALPILVDAVYVVVIIALLTYQIKLAKT